MSDRSDTAAATSPETARNNRRTAELRSLYDFLPNRVKAVAVSAFNRFCCNRKHPSLRLHRLKETSKGQHDPDTFSVSVGSQYRARYFEDGDTNVRYWIGSHADYDKFPGVT